MDKHHLQEQAMPAEIDGEATGKPMSFISKVKAAMAAISLVQILKLILLGLALIAWYPLYSRLDPFSRWIAYDAFRLAHGGHMGEAVSFFFLDIPKVFMLLLLIVWGIGVVRSFFTPERTRTILAGKREFLGDVLAALLGVVTPFCSCSAVPLFIGFVEAGIPIGVTFAFLISAPMVNEIALAMLFAL
ncbi:MAG: permease, partial [Desulfobaccales bacterium]